ncbi:MAG: MFS transporter [Ruminococcaceae bacterium]|nr:MFS transporter [Oscillospiraceae bacterium]
MKLWNRDFTLMFFSNYLVGTSFVSIQAILPLYVNDIGGNNSITGTMILSMTLIMMFSRPILGSMLDRVGRKPILYIGCIAYVINTLAYFAAVKVEILFALRLMQGITSALYTSSAATLIADVVPKDRMVEGLGYYGISGTLCFVTGPILGKSLYEKYGFNILLISASIIVIVGCLFVAFMTRTDKSVKFVSKSIENDERRGISKFIEFSVIIPSVISCFIFMGNSSINNFMTAAGLSRGIESISVFFVFNGIALIVARGVTSFLTRNLGENRTVIGGILIFFVGIVIVAFAKSTVAVVLSGLLCGFGNGTSSPILNSFIFRISPENRKGAANATYSLFNDIGNGVGGAVHGVVSQNFGYTAMFLSASAMLLVSFTIYTSILIPKLKRLKSS